MIQERIKHRHAHRVPVGNGVASPVLALQKLVTALAAIMNEFISVQFLDDFYQLLALG